MKNRTKELGLYSVLGLEKRHLHLMLFLELVIFAVITSTLGIMLGALLDKLAFAFLMKVMQFPVQIVQGFHWTNVILTLTIFMGVYALILLLNIVRIHRLKPIELLKESKKGEKHSRFLMLQTLIGLTLLGFGYYLAQTVSRPIKSLPIFFTAVLFVVAATYILFTAGSITLLTFLKKKKNYYYQPQNFISVSNLIFRMRKNAVGLATICLLSTMALVTTVGGTALFIGTENYIKSQAPHSFGITIYPSDKSTVKQKTKDLETMAQSLDIDLQPAVSIEYVDFLQVLCPGLVLVTGAHRHHLLTGGGRFFQRQGAGEVQSGRAGIVAGHDHQGGIVERARQLGGPDRPEDQLARVADACWKNGNRATASPRIEGLSS